MESKLIRNRDPEAFERELNEELASGRVHSIVWYGTQQFKTGSSVKIEYSVLLLLAPNAPTAIIEWEEAA